MFWLTGVRVGSILTARWDDLHVERGILVLRAQHTKPNKDHILHIGQALPELSRIRQRKEYLIFPWDYHRRTLDSEWQRIQKEASIRLACPEADQHECIDTCYLYGFHDLRRAHATYNYGPVQD